MYVSIPEFAGNGPNEATVLVLRAKQQLQLYAAYAPIWPLFPFFPDGVSGVHKDD